MNPRDVSPPALDDLFRQRYRIEDLIAHGGMGVVYRGVHLAMSRDVAIKTIRPGADDFARAAARFRREVEIGKQLRHPNIIELYDFGESDGGLYVVMELLEGTDLKETLARDGPLSLGRSCEIVLQTLDALSEAHRNGFMHRDVKPSNIFLTHRGNRPDFVKLLDFGVARGVDAADSDLTRHGEVCGTSAYIAPEVFLQGEIGYATDVYAVGLILLECLTGRKVINGRTAAESLLLHVRSTIEVPALFAATPVADVIRKAIAKTPQSRYADADEMHDALSAAMEASPLELRLPEPVETDVEIDVGHLLDGLEELLGSSGALSGAAQGTGSSDILLTSESREVLESDELATLLKGRSELSSAGGDGSFGRGFVIAVTAVIAIVAVIGVGMLPAGDDEQVADGASEMSSTPGALVAETTTNGSNGASAENVRAETTSGDAEPDGEDVVWVELDTVPRGVTVYRDEELIGTAPRRVRLSSEDQPVNYRFEASGYAPDEIEVDPSLGNHVVKVKLTKLTPVKEKPTPVKQEAKQEVVRQRDDSPQPVDAESADERSDRRDERSEESEWGNVEVDLFDRDD